MIYITGDCHGHYKRFTKKRFPTQRMMSKQDYVIVCGDFGLWDRSKKQEYYRKWLNGRNFTLLWVDGNHENYDMLKEYEIVEWKGGKVQFINPSIIHLMRGQIYEIDGLKIFTFGGARCHDIEGGVLELDDEHLAEKSIELEKKGIFYRVNHQSWWAEEMPSREERDEGIHNLGKYQNEVDYIITHCAPTSIQNYFTEGNYVTDELTDYLEGLKGSIKFKKWYFGHYHDNRIFEEKFCLLYKHIELLEDKAEDSGSAGSKTEDRGNAESRLPDGIPETKTEYRRNTESKPADGIAETKTEDSRNAESRPAGDSAGSKTEDSRNAESRPAGDSTGSKTEGRRNAESRSADGNAGSMTEGRSDAEIESGNRSSAQSKPEDGSTDIKKENNSGIEKSADNAV